MKYVRFSLLLMLLLSLAAGLLRPASHQETEFLMDTVVSVTAYGSGGKEAVERVFLRLREIDRKCSAHHPESELAKINSAPKDTPVAIDSEVYGLIQAACRFTETSEGLFDITLLPLSRLWGFGTPEAAVPPAEAISSALQLAGTDGLQFDDENQTITKRRDGICLDLGGVAKGYAADEALRVLKEAGMQSAYVDLGGNVAVMGGKPLSLWERLFRGQKTRPFTIGLQTPGATRGTVMETLSVSDGFVVTSGDYERYFEQDGRLYHHILDPRTGYPAESGLKSVTVVAPSGMMADMLSTALFVAGSEEMPALYAACDEIITINEAMDLHYVKKSA